MNYFTLRLIDQKEGSFCAVEAPFANVDEFCAALNEGGFIPVDLIHSAPEINGVRHITRRDRIGICADGIDWVRESGMTYTENNG